MKLVFAPLALAFVLATQIAPAVAATCGAADAPGANPDLVFAHDFDDATAAGGDPSGGTGGQTAAGNYDSSFAYSTNVTKPLYWRVPPGYVAGEARPLLVVLHGSNGAGGQNTAARN